jgi:hypothetical protein
MSDDNLTLDSVQVFESFLSLSQLELDDGIDLQSSYATMLKKFEANKKAKLDDANNDIEVHNRYENTLREHNDKVNALKSKIDAFSLVLNEFSGAHQKAIQRKLDDAKAELDKLIENLILVKPKRSLHENEETLSLLKTELLEYKGSLLFIMLFNKLIGMKKFMHIKTGYTPKRLSKDSHVDKIMKKYERREGRTDNLDKYLRFKNKTATYRDEIKSLLGYLSFCNKDYLDADMSKKNFPRIGLQCIANLGMQGTDIVYSLYRKDLGVLNEYIITPTEDDEITVKFVKYKELKLKTGYADDGKRMTNKHKDMQLGLVNEEIDDRIKFYPIGEITTNMNHIDVLNVVDVECIFGK